MPKYVTTRLEPLLSFLLEVLLETCPEGIYDGGTMEPWDLDPLLM
jgi:hypothetical protein